MLNDLNLIVLIKYIICFALVMVIILAPAYLARINKKDGLNMLIIRVSTWLFGWTGIGWLFGLYWAVKK